MPGMQATYHRPPALPGGDPAVRAIASRLLAALCLTLALATLGSGSAASAAAPSTLVIEGAGDGHGVGMSQDGALGYARHGWTYQAILAHYYTGTTIGQAPAKTVVKVLVGSKVKRVPLERYVRGVVSAEMPSSWPAAALEAQAVASRTYALTAHAGGSPLRRLLRHPLAGLSGRSPPKRRDERRRGRDRRADRALRGAGPPSPTSSPAPAA